MLLAKMEFQLKAEFIKDDVCAYVDNIVSFEANEEFHSVCLFVWFKFFLRKKYLIIFEIYFF